MFLYIFWEFTEKAIFNDLNVHTYILITNHYVTPRARCTLRAASLKRQTASDTRQHSTLNKLPFVWPQETEHPNIQTDVYIRHRHVLLQPNGHKHISLSLTCLYTSFIAHIDEGQLLVISEKGLSNKILMHYYKSFKRYKVRGLGSVCNVFYALLVL